MSTFESAYKSLLQGVSQQLPEERLPGQLTAQVNMVSDPVTNLRRRPGLKMNHSWGWSGASTDTIRGWFTDVGGVRVHVFLNTSTGNIRVYDEQFNLEASLDAGQYLQAPNASRIRATTVRNEFFIANLDKIPTIQRSAKPTYGDGFFYVVSGAFSKQYDLIVGWDGVEATTVSYTTPSGTGATDANDSTPEYIATQLTALLAAARPEIAIQRMGPYLYIRRNNTTGFYVNTSSGSGYAIASRGGSVQAQGNLPAQLPAGANGYVCKVGTGKSPQYFKYVSASVEWVETSAQGSPSAVLNTPVSLFWNGTGWELNLGGFAGSTAGDDVSNPLHEWMEYGLSGIGTYQGRLVLLSGPMVSMSESNKPRNFFRTTVTQVLGSDPIEVGSSLNSAAAYEWAIPFQKDLLLFSAAYQAVIPSNNTALTPANAMVVATSTHESDTTSSPITLGRTVMYCTPRSENFFGVMEMIPSSYTDSQYVSQDTTPHLPKFMPGRCRFAVSSGVSPLALMAPSGDPRTLLVHEYHWDGDQKVQQAWHQWTFPYDICTAYFSADRVNIVFVRNNTVLVGSLDARTGNRHGGNGYAFLDLSAPVEVVNNRVQIPAWMRNIDPSIGTKLALEVLGGPLAGEPIGTTLSQDGTELITVESFPNGTVTLGIPYRSTVVLTPPIIRDYQDNVIHTGKATLYRLTVGMRDSREFQASVTDDYSGTDEFGVPTLSWSSKDLQLGQRLTSGHTQCIIPCRTDIRSSQVELWVEGAGEMNITSVEYVAKYHPKIKRR